MSAGIGDLTASLKLSAAPFKSGLSESLQSMRSFAKTFAAIAAPIGGAFALGHSIEAAGEQMRAQKKLAAVLDATGHAAGFSSGELVDLSKSLAKTTNFSADTTQNAMATLATFKGIQGVAFTDTIKSAQDLATLTGGDLVDTTRMLGKALSDPVKGMNVLRRAGVALTADQQANVKKLMSAGDLGGAQKVILEGLKGSVGGLAQTMASPITQMGNMLNEVAGNIGLVMLPVLKVIATTIEDMIGPIADNRDTFIDLGKSIAEVVGVALQLAGAILGPVVTSISTSWQMLKGWFSGASIGMGDLSNVWNLGCDNMLLGVMKLVPGSEGVFSKIGVILAASIDFMGATLEGVWNGVKNFFSNVWEIIKAFGRIAAASWSAAFNLQDPMAAGIAQMKKEWANLDMKELGVPIKAGMDAFSKTFNDATQGLADQGGLAKAVGAHRDGLAASVKDAMSNLPPVPVAVKPTQEFKAAGLGAFVNKATPKAGKDQGAKQDLKFDDIRGKAGLDELLKAQSPNGKDDVNESIKQTAKTSQAQLDVLEDISDKLDEDDGVELD